MSCFYQMTISLRRPNFAQYDRSWQNWPELTFKRHATSFFSEFLITDKVFEISVSNCMRKKCVVQKFERKSLQMGQPTAHFSSFPLMKFFSLPNNGNSQYETPIQLIPTHLTQSSISISSYVMSGF